MAAITDLTLSNRTTGERFLFRAVSNFNNKKLQPPVSIPLVNTSPQNTLLFRFIGQSEEINFEFAIFNDGVDVSDNSHSPEIITVGDQVKYLRDTIYTKDFDGTYALKDNTGRFYPSTLLTAITGVVTNLTFNQTAGAGTVVTGTLTFTRGKIAQL